MYWKILDEKRQRLLESVANAVSGLDFYMAGGTALSLQMGLRKSVDFDFFHENPFNENSVLFHLQQRFPDLKILQKYSGTLDLDIDEVQVSFFHYPYPMLKSFVVDEELPVLKMAHPCDIAAMKMSAIGGRGAKKDFYDLYQICNTLDVEPSEMYDILRGKFGLNTDFSYMVIGLSYFGDAEEESLREVFVHADWGDIKRFFIPFAEKMGDIIMGQM